jgi:hypothetical protein
MATIIPATAATEGVSMQQAGRRSFGCVMSLEIQVVTGEEVTEEVPTTRAMVETEPVFMPSPAVHRSLTTVTS